ncbi:MAG: endo-1,4-beta-xylanase [Prolixibacteraceae bacterium]|jgi:GH35 family endo-1,4-beta-xylanase|nr:endo-1,4-beta-xylanase [Prolixibacteraceae bacterium]
MKILKHVFIVSILMNLLLINVAANDSINSNLKPIIVEAESGLLGSNFSTSIVGDITYITTNADFSGQSNPENSNSIATYQVAFVDTGSYQVFARVRVGSGSYSDDSFFGAIGFGEKDFANGDGWLMINGLAGAGFNGTKDVVLELGSVGSEEWKWINLTKNFYQNSNVNFNVRDELAQAFQIGSREDGLDFDKLAFGKAGLYYTVNALDNGLDGLTEIPIDSSLYQGPPIAEGSPKFLGNVKDWNDDNFANIWNQLTPGNEGKWASIGNSLDTLQWNWSGLDNLYNYAQENGMVFKDHTLIWGAQQPSWMNSLSNEEQLKYIETWMRQVGQRYPDMDMIDVVNESIATHNPPDGQGDRANYKEALGGDGASGYDWVVKSFELARKYMPATTKLLLNDYGIINDNNATNTYLQIINLLNERKLIDGIGVQCHRFEIQNASITTLKNNLDRLAATGLPIYISEMDLGDSSGDDDAPYDDALQLQKYQDIFPIFWEHPSVAGVTLWGSLEGRMWQKTCHVINSDNSWRPALDWIAEYVANTPVEINLVEDTSNVEITYTYFETECAQAGSNWNLFAETDASNGHYMTVKTGVQSASEAPTEVEDLIVFPVSIQSTDQYNILARVKCPSADDDSFWSFVDNGDAQMANGLTTSGWEWKILSNFYLSEGEHDLSIGYREDGALIDKICITNSYFPPVGLGEEAENKCDTMVVSNAIPTFVDGELIQCFPNPFLNSLTFKFRIEKQENVTLKIYDMLGSEITTLVDQQLDQGIQTITWDASNNNGLKVKSGNYFYRLELDGQFFSGKIMMLD